MTFLVSFLKAWLWIAVGTLIRNHIETVFTMISRKSLANGLIEPTKYELTKKGFRIIGGITMAIGIILMVLAFVTLYLSFNLPSGNFKLNF